MNCPGAGLTGRLHEHWFPRDAYRLTFAWLPEKSDEKPACQLMVDLLVLAHERGCEAELATILAAGLAADEFPNMAVLRERFAPGRADRSVRHRFASRPDPATRAGSTVPLTPLAAYEALLGDDTGEAS